MEGRKCNILDKTIENKYPGEQEFGKSIIFVNKKYIFRSVMGAVIHEICILRLFI